MLKKENFMKNIIKLSALFLCLTLMSINAPSSKAANGDLKFATVDVQKVVVSSKQVNNLKNEQNAKMRELSEFVQKANKQLSETTDPKKKAELEKKLNNELMTKKTAIDKTYAQKLEEVDKNVQNSISTVAKEKGYDYVFAKGILLYGKSTDITNDVIKKVK